MDCVEEQLVKRNREEYFKDIESAGLEIITENVYSLQLQSHENRIII